MKKFFIPIAVLVALFLIVGCSQKFNIGAPYKNITVVDGFLDQADTAHYIRIQKAFLDQNKSALTMSKEPDSSFYSNINVKINRINAASTIYDTIHLNRVNLDNEGYPKQPGVFFNSPNYAYKFTNKLDPAYKYQLVITNLATGEVDSSSTDVFVDTDSTIFYVDVLVIPYNFNALDFSNTGVNANGYNVQVRYGVSDIPLPGIFQSILRFNWYDSTTDTHLLSHHSYDFDMGYITPPNTTTFKPLDNDLYKAIFAGMGIAPSNTVRLLDRCEQFVYISTTDFANYQQASSSQGLGLTGSEIEPIYTNIKGANALGLYTAKGVRSGKITITPICVDSLIASPFLAPTRIVGNRY